MCTMLLCFLQTLIRMLQVNSFLCSDLFVFVLFFVFESLWLHVYLYDLLHVVALGVNRKGFLFPFLLGLLRQKDIEQALLLEEKMSLQLRLLAAAGLDPPSPPSYRHLVSENADTGQMWKEVLTAVQVVN